MIKFVVIEHGPHAGSCLRLNEGWPQRVLRCDCGRLLSCVNRRHENSGVLASVSEFPRACPSCGTELSLFSESDIPFHLREKLGINTAVAENVVRFELSLRGDAPDHARKLIEGMIETISAGSVGGYEVPMGVIPYGQLFGSPYPMSVGSGKNKKKKRRRRITVAEMLSLGWSPAVLIEAGLSEEDHGRWQKLSGKLFGRVVPAGDKTYFLHASDISKEYDLEGLWHVTGTAVSLHDTKASAVLQPADASVAAEYAAKALSELAASENILWLGVRDENPSLRNKLAHNMKSSGWEVVHEHPMRPALTADRDDMLFRRKEIDR